MKQLKSIIWLVLIAAVAWKFWPQLDNWLNADSHIQPVMTTASHVPNNLPAATRSSFKCDGRQYCSQMTSCTEAKAFLQNCPGMKMDGNNDGVPCETQWCK